MPETQPSNKRLGALVVLFSIVLGTAPYIGKAYLRASVPSLSTKRVVEAVTQSTFHFFMSQMHTAMQAVHHDGEQLAAHCPQSRTLLAKFRNSITVLDQFHTKYEEWGVETYQEMERPSPYGVLKADFEQWQDSVKKAQQRHIFMMIVFTAIAAVFLTGVMRSKRVPTWAKYFAMIACGAVIGAWFPL
jgi:hypothetical protein